MDALDSGILEKPPNPSCDLFQELLQFNQGLGFQGEDSLIDILSSPISPSHGCIPHQDNCHPVSAAQCIFQLNVDEQRCFMGGDTEEDMRPLLDMVPPVSVPLLSPVRNAPFMLEYPSSSTMSNHSSALQRGMNADISSATSSASFGGGGKSTSADPFVTTASATPLPQGLTTQPPVPPLPSLSTAISPEAFLATVLKDPTLVASPHESVSQVTHPVASVSLETVSHSPTTLLESVKVQWPGLMSTISSLSSAQILQTLNSLGEVSTLSKSLQTCQPLEGTKPLVIDTCPSHEVSPYSSTTVSPLPAPQIRESDLGSVATDFSLHTAFSTPASSCLPSPMNTNDCLSSDEADVQDSIGPDVLSSFTHIDWTNKRRGPPSLHQTPSPLQDTVATSSAAEVTRVPSPKHLPPQKRHAGGWPKGKPRRKDRQSESVSKPKLPLSGYAFFLSETRRRLIAENPNNSVNEINKELGRIWSTMESKRKGFYYEKAAVDKKRYLKEVQLYVGSKLEKCHDDLADAILKAVDEKFIEIVSVDQDNQKLWCGVCNKRFVSIANKFAHIESKAHLGALTYSLEKLVAVLLAKNPDERRSRSCAQSEPMCAGSTTGTESTLSTKATAVLTSSVSKDLDQQQSGSSGNLGVQCKGLVLPSDVNKPRPEGAFVEDGKILNTVSAILQLNDENENSNSSYLLTSDGRSPGTENRGSCEVETTSCSSSSDNGSPRMSLAFADPSASVATSTFRSTCKRACDIHKLTSVPLFTPQLSHEYNREASLNLKSIFQEPVTSLSKLLHDFAKIKDVLSAECKVEESKCTRLSREAMDLQMKCGELEYVLNSLKQEQAILKDAHKDLVSLRNKLLKEWT